ncbi:hypothetical protein OAU50_02405 [Planctomycetota bacterium]|nr:hypothetical protein [Planctomycetota bacterium]
MPINLRYGQQAVARGFVSSQRLEQVLAKQRQLKDQGKNVSVRMILEKAKLLDADQLQQIDRDLNIKVVKKKTAKLQRPGVPPAPAPAPSPMGAQNFAGEAPPQFGGMDGGADADATLFSPPPPDMQQRVSAERDAAKAQQRADQEAELQGFLNEDASSPFGEDPFGGGAFGAEQSPAPMQPAANDPFGAEMQPMGMAEDPFGAEAQPMAPMADDPFGAEMQPMGMDADPFGAAEPIDSTAQYPIPQDAPAELDRLDSSPKLASLAAEFNGFSTGEDEELPMVEAGFDQPMAPAPQVQPFAGPDLAPAGGGFDAMGEDLPQAPSDDFMSPDQMEAAPAQAPAADLNATMFSPPPPGMMGSPREKTGAMEKTMFSPPPPGFKEAAQAAAAPEPAGDDWGEEPPAVAAIEGADMDATLFSPPPPGVQGGSSGRQGVDDFGDVDIPAAGAPVGDVPTAPAAGDPVHPIRQGVSTSSAHQNKQRPTTSSQQVRPPSSSQHVALPDDDEVLDELPSEEPVMGRPKLPGGKGLPGKGLPGGKGLPSKKSSGSSAPIADVAGDVEGEEEPKKKGKKLMLVLMLLLLLVLAALIIPIAKPGLIPPLDDFRNGQGKTIYDKVQGIYDNYASGSKASPQGAEPASNAPAVNAPQEGTE